MKNNKSGKTSRLLNRWFYIFLIVTIVVNVLLRCIHIDSRLYWGDEIVTSLRIEGYTYPEIIQELVDKSTANIADLMVYQQPNSVRSLATTLQGLVTEEPQHTPIYFLLIHIWTHLFKDWGSSVVVGRSFSVFISLVSFPSLYWLCLELFRSRYVGLVAIAMMAASPFHLVYAQEARPTVLWFLAIILSSASLLRAIRSNTNLNWIIYCISIIFNLYTFLFSVFAIAGHGVYIAVMQGFRLTKDTVAYLISLLVSVLAFLPWILVIISKLNIINNATDWSSEKIGSLNLLRMTLNNFRDVFFNFGEGYAFLTFLLVYLTLFSLYFLVKNTSKSVWVFVFSLIGVSLIVLLVPDLIMGGRVRSTASRYFIVSYLGIHLSLAYLLSTQINAVTKWLRNFWKMITALLLVLGTVSCIAIAQSDVSFNQATYRHSAMIAKRINKYENPLVITSAKFSNNIIGAIGLSYTLNPDSKFQFINDANQIQIPPETKAIFVYGGSSESILSAINTKYKSTLIFDDLNNQCCAETLWYLEAIEQNL